MQKATHNHHRCRIHIFEISFCACFKYSATFLAYRRVTYITSPVFTPAPLSRTPSHDRVSNRRVYTIYCILPIPFVFGPMIKSSRRDVRACMLHTVPFPRPRFLPSCPGDRTKSGSYSIFMFPHTHTYACIYTRMCTRSYALVYARERERGEVQLTQHGVCVCVCVRGSSPGKSGAAK